jgi:hypothetical protein
MSFIQDFMEYNSGNECPRPYVLWTAYGLLSAAMGRRVFIEIETWKWATTDIYILLIGPSGNKKTAALVIGKELLSEAVPDIVFSGDNETYQGIIKYMADDSSTRFYKNDKGGVVSYKPYCIFATELMGFLELNPVAMVNFLTTVYGLKHYEYKLKNETISIENPYVMMCSASVPEWLTDQIKAKQFAAGYGRRSIIVCAEEEPHKWPTFTPEHELARIKCVERLKQIQNISGQMIVTPDAFAWFKNWYLTQRKPDDRFLRNWYSTIDMNLLKLATLTSISERDDKVVTLDHMKFVWGQLQEVEKQLPMVTERLGRSETIEPALDVKLILTHHGGQYPEKQLLMDTGRHFKSTQEQWYVMKWLRDTGQIKLVEDATTKIKWYVLTPQEKKEN